MYEFFLSSFACILFFLVLSFSHSFAIVCMMTGNTLEKGVRPLINNRDLVLVLVKYLLKVAKDERFMDGKVKNLSVFLRKLFEENGVPFEFSCMKAIFPDETDTALSMLGMREVCKLGKPSGPLQHFRETIFPMIIAGEWDFQLNPDEEEAILKVLELKIDNGKIIDLKTNEQLKTRNEKLKERNDDPEFKAREQTTEYKATRKKYRDDPENKEKKKKYRDDPENKEKAKKYRDDPENKEKARAREQTMENKLKRREREQKPENKLKRKEREQTTEYKATRKKYRDDPENKEKAKKYRDDPENKEKARAREQTMKYKEKRKEYRDDPENKEKAKKYRDDPENKEKAKKYRDDPENKEKAKKYRDDPENKEKARAREQTTEYKATRKKYRDDPENKEKRKEYRDDPENKLKRKERDQKPENKLKRKEYKKRRKIEHIKQQLKFPPPLGFNAPCATCPREKSRGWMRAIKAHKLLSKKFDEKGLIGYLPLDKSYNILNIKKRAAKGEGCPKLNQNDVFCLGCWTTTQVEADNKIAKVLAERNKNEQLMK